MATGWRNTVLETARRAGLEPGLRQLQRQLEPREAKRDRRDGEHLELLLALALPADANCIDVGANVGDVAERIATRHPGGRHFAFEPLPELAARVAERCPGIHVRNAAVGDEPGRATFYRNVKAHSRSSLDRSEAQTSPDALIDSFEVDVVTLDDVLPRTTRPSSSRSM